MKFSATIIACVIVSTIGIIAAKEGLSDFFTKPIQARFDENTVVWTTHAQARQMGMQHNLNNVFLCLESQKKNYFMV